MSSTRLIKESSIIVHLPHANTTYHIFPMLEYDYEALYAAVEPFPETVTIRVTEYNNTPRAKPQTTEKKVVVDVRSVYDCLHAYVDAVNNRHEHTPWMHAAYVDENASVLDEILQQANCVEGSVLFASIFKKTGVISDLVLVPHHCFICVYLDKERQIPFFLETTMLGRTVRQSKEFEEGSPLAPVNKAKAGHEVSFNTFVAAQASAYKTFHSFDNDPDREAKRKLINISDCRKMGITPLRNPLPPQSSHSS